MKAPQAWILTYGPSTYEGGHSRHIIYEGTFEELTAYFLKNIVCQYCKEDMKGGVVNCFVSDEGGERYEEWPTEPYDDPWATGCGREWDYQKLDAESLEDLRRYYLEG